MFIFSKKRKLSMKAKLLLVMGLVMCCSFAQAQSEQQIIQITNQAMALMKESASAADRHDIYNACNKGKQAVKTWYKIDPRAVPKHVIQDFYQADVMVRNYVSIFMDVCGKY
jgi:nitrous oxide reductase